MWKLCAVSMAIFGLSLITMDINNSLVSAQIDGYEPDVDYPAYDSVPRDLSFSCANRLPGYYADIETRCQVWHWCLHSGHMYDFLCPNGTVFNQAYRVCDWWSNVDCPTSEQLYSNNEELYRDAEGNLICGEARRDVGGDDEGDGPAVISTTTRTPLEPLVRRPTLAKLLDKQTERFQHHPSTTGTKNHLVEENTRIEDSNTISSSRGRISGRMRFPSRGAGAGGREGGAGTVSVVSTPATRVNTTEKQDVANKLFIPNDINIQSNYSRTTTTAEKSAKEQRKGTGYVLNGISDGGKVDKATKKGGRGRGSRKFTLNAHDKDEVEFMKQRLRMKEESLGVIENSIANPNDRLSTTTKRTSQTTTFANKYNIDYDNTLEDEFEIIEKVE